MTIQIDTSIGRGLNAGAEASTTAGSAFLRAHPFKVTPANAWAGDAETPEAAKARQDMSDKSSGAASSSSEFWGELIGRSVPRVEDARLLRGQARFIDDIVLPGMLHAVFARSRSAHARIARIDTAAAEALPGVHAVLLYADLRPVLSCDRIPLALAAAAVKFDAEPISLVNDEATDVGEPIALVVADNRRIAEDAAALIDIDYDELPVVTDPRDGLSSGAPRA